MCGGAAPAQISLMSGSHESLLISHFVRARRYRVTVINIEAGPVAGGGAPDSLDYGRPYGGIAGALRNLSPAINYA